jgi:tubulin-specific chaperone D
VCRALHYEERRGVHSIGSHVRDSAAYVCWAFARAYRPEAILESFHVLAPALLCTACYDREVNCRRAASAAFQESVGRLGAQHFPDGINIISAADYFSLGSRSQAFLTVAPAIAQRPQYRVPLTEHLVEIKLGSFDENVRDLAARSLGALVPEEPDYFCSVIVPQLLGRCTAKGALEMQHGSLLGVAELFHALHKAGQDVGKEIQTRAVQMVIDVQHSELSRGKGGELIRLGLCKVTSAFGMLHIKLSDCQVCQDCLNNLKP